MSTAQKMVLGICGGVAIVAALWIWQKGKETGSPSLGGTAQKNLPGETAAPTPPEVSVETFSKEPAKYAGDVAIRGVVSQVFETKQTFLMIDAEEFKTCGLGCSTCVPLPVRMDRQKIDGSLPKVEDEVLVVATARVEGEGYALDVKEVRKGGAVILRASSPSR